MADSKPCPEVTAHCTAVVELATVAVSDTGAPLAAVWALVGVTDRVALGVTVIAAVSGAFVPSLALIAATAALANVAGGV